ncbi:lycopene cyclase domain-containing protein [Candidatus Saccharibacteria bacterium]|nr:lycopene cyclase domain-containing protein [Candidatus Saccharibacteria bacterium]NCU40332.1 lycopene cyclase domain-containing protein [Candidatus Saccharibacteria bacterium]
MATYLVLNLVVSAVILVFLILSKLLVWNRAVWVTLIILLLTTVVFDSLIINAGIVAYNPDNLLGIYVAKAPVEDFFYTIIAAVLIPGLWNIFKRGDRADN